MVPALNGVPSKGGRGGGEYFRSECFGLFNSPYFKVRNEPFESRIQRSHSSSSQPAEVNAQQAEVTSQQVDCDAQLVDGAQS